jgi:hypothetical protein
MAIAPNSIITPQRPFTATAVATTANSTYSDTPTNTVLLARQDLLPPNPFTTVNASAVVTVSHPDHGLFTGTQITVSGAAAVGGITPSGAYVITVTSADAYTITHGSNATSGATGGGTACLAQLARTSANGARITRLTALARATNTATELQLYVSNDGGTTKRLIRSVTLPAYSVVQTAGQTAADMGYSDSAPLILGASEILYVGIGVTNTGIVFRAEGFGY